MGALGAPAAHAERQTEVLVEAELRGHPSHGLLRLPTIATRIQRGLIDPAARGAHDWRATAFLDVDGQNGLGPVVAERALAALGERATETGIAIAAMRRTSHLGMLAWYVERVARTGRVGIATCTSEALVHPWGGRRAMVGTNPIAIGVPAEPGPLVVDLSTGEVSMGKVLAHARRDQPIPAGWALDENGDPTTDAKVAARGSIAPFGGPKGYALGLALEVLVVALTGTAAGPAVRGTLDVVHPSTKGDLLIVVDGVSPELVAAVSAYLHDVRESPSADPSVPVSVPGDRSAARRAAALSNGIDIADSTLAELKQLVAHLESTGISPT